MPFKSQKQRGLMRAAAQPGTKGRRVRRKHGIKLKVAKKMVRHDPGGKLPTKVGKGRGK